MIMYTLLPPHYIAGMQFAPPMSPEKVLCNAISVSGRGHVALLFVRERESVHTWHALYHKSHREINYLAC